MLMTTKKMREDLKKSREQDLIVCDYCGSEDLSEKMWVDSNSYIQVDGETYYKYCGEVDDGQFWCEKCNDMTHPTHISEYKEREDAEQKNQRKKKEKR